MVNNKCIWLSALLVVATGLSSCTDASKKKTEQQGTQVTAEVKSLPVAGYFGTYEGTLPCADCDGNQVSLAILEDGTYELKNEFLGKEANNYTECGTYSVEDGVIVLLTPSSGRKTYYKVLDGAVALSDSTGTLNQGELADKYVLKKK